MLLIVIQRIKFEVLHNLKKLMTMIVIYEALLPPIFFLTFQKDSVIVFYDLQECNDNFEIIYSRSII